MARRLIDGNFAQARPKGVFPKSASDARPFVRRSDDAVIDVLAHQYVLRLPLADLLAEVQAGVAPSSFIGVMV